MERYHVYLNGTLRITNVKSTDNGRYKCVAKNEKGDAESAGTAFVLGKSSLLSSINKNHWVDLDAFWTPEGKVL